MRAADNRPSVSGFDLSVWPALKADGSNKNMMGQMHQQRSSMGQTETERIQSIISPNQSDTRLHYQSDQSC